MRALSWIKSLAFLTLVYPATAAADPVSRVPDLLAEMTNSQEARRVSAALHKLYEIPADELKQHQSAIIAAARGIAGETGANRDALAGALVQGKMGEVLRKLGASAGPQVVPVLEELLTSAPEASGLVSAMPAYGPTGVAALGRVLDRFDPAKQPAHPQAGSVCSRVCYAVIFIEKDATPLVKRISALLKNPDLNLRIAALKALAAIGPPAASELPLVNAIDIDRKKVPSDAEATLIGVQSVARRRLAGTAIPLPKNAALRAIPRSAGGPLTKDEEARDLQMLRYMLTRDGKTVYDEASWAVLGDVTGVNQSVALNGVNADLHRLALVQSLVRSGSPQAPEWIDRLTIAHIGAEKPLPLLLWQERWMEIGAALRNTDGDSAHHLGPMLARSFDHATSVKCLQLLPSASQFGLDARSTAWLGYGTELLKLGDRAGAVEALERGAKLGPGTREAATALLHLAALGEGARVVAAASAKPDPSPHAMAMPKPPSSATNHDLAAATLAYIGDMASARKLLDLADGNALASVDPVIMHSRVQLRASIGTALIRRGDVQASRAWADESVAAIAAICKTRYRDDRLNVASSLAGVIAMQYRALGDDAAARKVMKTAATAIDAERGVALLPPPQSPSDPRSFPNTGVGGDPFRRVPPQPNLVPQARGGDPRDTVCDDVLAQLALAQHAVGYTDDGLATASLIRHRIKRDSIEQDLARPVQKANQGQITSINVANIAIAGGAGDWNAVLLSATNRGGPTAPYPPRVSIPAGVPAQPLLDRLAMLSTTERLEGLEESELHGCIAVLGGIDGSWSNAADILARSKRPAQWLVMLAQSRAEAGDKAAVGSIYQTVSKVRPVSTPLTVDDVVMMVEEARQRVLAGDKAGAVVVLRKAFPRKGPNPAMVPEGTRDMNVKRVYINLGQTWAYASDAISALQFAETLPAEAQAMVISGIRRALHHRLSGIEPQFWE